MSRVWKHNGKIVMKDGKVVLCDDCPCGEEERCVTIPSRQFYNETEAEPHYRRQIASFTANFSGVLYANGTSDDTLEVSVNGQVAFSDHSPEDGGKVTSYNNKALCRISKGASVQVYVWDSAYSYIGWSGTIQLCRLDNEDFE